MKWRYILTLVAVLLPLQAHAQIFDNNSIIALHMAGLGENALMAKIGNVPCGYDVSTEGLIKLKQAGVSDNVIATMVERCNASSRAQGVSTTSVDPTLVRPPGLYLLQDWATPAKMFLMRPSKAGGVKVSGNGSILFPLVGKLIIPDAKSNTVVQGNSPAFFFYFDPSDGKVSNFGSADSTAAQSPEEFTLVRFKVKDGAREVVTGKISAYSAKRGIDPKVAIRFVSEEIGDAIFKVTVSSPLTPGEYGFVLTGANNASRVYDFSLQ